MTTMDELSAIDALCKVDLPEEKYTIERSGLELLVRGLSHDEALELQAFSAKESTTNQAYEQLMLSWAVVWPKMSRNQIKAWQKASPAGEINALVKVVRRLSGMDEEAAKDAYKSVSGEPDAGE